MKQDISTVLDELKREEKGPHTLYFSKEVFSDFKKRCGKIPPSRVLEKLMVAFIKSKKAA